MESILPKTRVPDEWIHPVLKKQMAERSQMQTSSNQRLKMLEKQRTDMENIINQMQKSLSSKKSNLEEMDRLREKVIEGIKKEETQASQISYVCERIADQIIVQKTLGQQKLNDIQSIKTLQSPFCALSVNCFKTWSKLSSCFKSNEEIMNNFYSSYAPLFSIEKTLSPVLPKVNGPIFFDEICLMEINQEVCKSPACPYWHQNQLSHVKLSLQELLSRASVLIKGQSNICDVATMFVKLSKVIETSTNLADIVRIQRDVINFIANIGWAEAFIEEKYNIAWEAPLLKLSKKNLEHINSLLRKSREYYMWQHFLKFKSEPICAATELFQQYVNSFSWRCLIRIAGTTTERTLWLATRGIDLFPTTPSIRLAYILALLKSKCLISDCVYACINSAQILSTHVGTLTLSQHDIQWCEVVARYIAYMIAMTCVYAAKTEPEMAIKLLEMTVYIPGKISLLPLALQNLTLMLIVLRQTKRLDDIYSLPLASISDVAFTLSEYFPHRPQEACGQLLSRQINILTGCTNSGIDIELTELMRSAIHISLMHAFSSDSQLVDQILIKSSIHSNIGMSEIWNEYLYFVRERDGTLSLIKLVHSLLDYCQSPLLMLNFLKCLEFHGEEVVSFTISFINKFANNHGILLDNIKNLVKQDSLNIPIDDWIPFIIIYSRHLLPLERIKLLCSIPKHLYCELTELVILLWFEIIQASLLLQDDTVFRHCISYGLLLLREPFLQSFSPLDYDFDEMISIAHVATLTLYKAIPILLGKFYQHTSHYRKIILDVSAELHVVHPYLRDTELNKEE